MDPNTGKIHHVADDADAKARGLLPIPDEELARVSRMSRLERRAWAAEKTGVPVVLTGAEHDAIAAAVAKRERQAARRVAEAKKAGAA